MGEKKVAVETVAQAYLELLGERGIDFFFANAGTDFAPLVDAFARLDALGRKGPVPVTVPHENAAVAMAYGYYLVTGRPQVVMVHVTVGTANGLNGIINAARDRVPIIFTAGRTPYTEAGPPGARDLYIHWAQESFDQGAMVREYVKWDYELRTGDHLEAVVDRAMEIAMAEPRGPVYLTLPREVLAAPLVEFTPTSPPRRHLGGRHFPDPATVDEAARMLAAARNPLIITTAAGRDPQAVGHLAALAEGLVIPVVTFNQRYLCFPTDHPLHLGFDPHPLLGKADCILAVESDVPWYPHCARPAPSCRVIHMGVDPLYGAYPLRSFPCDLAVRADAAVALPLLAAALASHCRVAPDEIAERLVRLRELHRAQRAAWEEELERVRDDSPLDPLWVSRCIDSVCDAETLIVNEYDLVQTQVRLTRPGSFFGNPTGGGLGWGLGAAIGARLGAPGKTVIATLGDGSYLFGNPSPCHFVAHALGAPTLTVVFNNRSWNAVRLATLRMYPDGWAARTNSFPLTSLEPSPRYELLVAASGGYGERVEEAGEVLPALVRGLRAVREEGRSAVLNMVCKKPGE